MGDEQMPKPREKSKQTTSGKTQVLCGTLRPQPPRRWNDSIGGACTASHSTTIPPMMPSCGCRGWKNAALYIILPNGIGTRRRHSHDLFADECWPRTKTHDRHAAVSSAMSS